MQLRLSGVFALTLLLFVGACADPAQENLIRLVDFGIYNSNRDSPQLLKMTDEIPATVGTVFGIRVLATGDHAANYDFRWSFPEMQNPSSGQVWTEMTGTKEVRTDGPQSFLVSMNSNWEAKAGDWNIQLIRAGQVTAEKSFRVYISESKPDWVNP